VFGDGNKIVNDHIDGAGTSGIFLNGNDNTIRFGYIGHSPVGLWFYGGLSNSWASVRFDDTVPLFGQGVYGGERDLTENSASPFVPLCHTQFDCDDGSLCTVDACD